MKFQKLFSPDFNFLKKKNHSTVTTFHSKLQQATRTRHQPSALCSRSLLPKGRSWNKHGIASLNYKCCRDISFSMVQIAPHLERKTKKQPLFFSFQKGTKICELHIYSTHLTYFIYMKDEELIACGSWWNLPTYSVCENMGRTRNPFEENEME